MGVEVVPTVETEPETIGELIESVVGKAVSESRKAWAKDLADLLDIGADTSETDPNAPPVDPTVPVVPVAPVVEGGVRGRKFSLL